MLMPLNAAASRFLLGRVLCLSFACAYASLYFYSLSIPGCYGFRPDIPQYPWAIGSCLLCLSCIFFVLLNEQSAAVQRIFFGLHFLFYLALNIHLGDDLFFREADVFLLEVCGLFILFSYGDEKTDTWRFTRQVSSWVLFRFFFCLLSPLIATCESFQDFSFFRYQIQLLEPSILGFYLANFNLYYVSKALSIFVLLGLYICLPLLTMFANGLDRQPLRSTLGFYTTAAAFLYLCFYESGRLGWSFMLVMGLLYSVCGPETTGFSVDICKNLGLTDEQSLSMEKKVEVEMATTSPTTSPKDKNKNSPKKETSQNNAAASSEESENKGAITDSPEDEPVVDATKEQNNSLSGPTKFLILSAMVFIPIGGALSDVQLPAATCQSYLRVIFCVTWIMNLMKIVKYRQDMNSVIRLLLVLIYMWFTFGVFVVSSNAETPWKSQLDFYGQNGFCVEKIMTDRHVSTMTLREQDVKEKHLELFLRVGPMDKKFASSEMRGVATKKMYKSMDSRPSSSMPLLRSRFADAVSSASRSSKKRNDQFLVEVASFLTAFTEPIKKVLITDEFADQRKWQMNEERTNFVSIITVPKIMEFDIHNNRWWKYQRRDLLSDEVLLNVEIKRGANDYSHCEELSEMEMLVFAGSKVEEIILGLIFVPLFFKMVCRGGKGRSGSKGKNRRVGKKKKD